MSATKEYLLDVNVLVAFAWDIHPHHERVREWFERKGNQARIATCAVTQAGFLRITCNPRAMEFSISFDDARNALTALTTHKSHRFVEAMPSLLDSSFSKIWPRLKGHAQMSDALLLCLAKHHGLIFATLDGGIPTLSPWPDVVELLA